MAIGTKRKGTRTEHRSRDLLEADGFSVIRAAGSHGAFDLAAFRADEIRLIQVKTNRWPSRAEMQTLRAFVVPANVIKLVHRWRDRVSLPDVRTL